MPQSATINSTSGNNPAFVIKKGTQGALIIQNPTAFRVFFVVNTALGGGGADATTVFIPAATGTGETLVPGVLTLNFPQPMGGDMTFFGYMTDVTGDKLLYQVLPYMVQL